MKLQQQYEALVGLQKEIDKRMAALDFHAIKELILYLAKSEEYQKLKGKDNRLSMLDQFCSIWMREKKNLEALGIHSDIFDGISSLNDVEEKYLTIKFGVLRLEKGMPGEYCRQFAEEVIRRRISGVALFAILMRETGKRKSNCLKLARFLKAEGQTVTALTFLQEAERTFAGSEELLLELADCWLVGRQYQAAFECLQRIGNPDREIRELLMELKGILHESV